MIFAQVEEVQVQRSHMSTSPRGGGLLPYYYVGGLGLPLHLEANLGQGPTKPFSKYERRGNLRKFGYHKRQKLEQNRNFGVIFEIQRANIGELVTCNF